MTFNFVLFLLMMWYSQKVQAGLEPHVLSILCPGGLKLLCEMHRGFLMLLLCLTGDRRSVA